MFLSGSGAHCKACAIVTVSGKGHVIVMVFGRNGVIVNHVQKEPYDCYSVWKWPGNHYYVLTIIINKIYD